MDAAAVGGAFLSAFLQVLFDRLASRDFINLFRGKKRTEILLKKLKITLLTLNPVLDDAEYKQFTNPAVKDWLDELKDAIYHADDLVNEIATEAMRSNQSQRIIAKVSKFVSNSIYSLLDEDIASKIAKIIETLDYFVNTKDVLGLKEVVGRNSSRRWSTTSLVDQDSVYGRDIDKDKIIQMVLSDDDPNGHHVSVIPIVGMGGVGKTTLAQLVYNDAKVQDHNFDIKAWVCVSEEFDILTVTKTILEAISDTCNTDDLNLLQVKLKNKLTGKKFLLVLDDVWNKNYSDWDLLRSVFTVGAHGSKIILTTRSRDVATIMQTVHIYHLEVLPDEECWSIFSKHAFENGNLGVLQNLETIGRKIVEKCKGLPLAAKTLGGLLRSKLEVKEWEDVLESEIWDLPNDESNILPALLLSYHHLPSNLKRCFAYCAIVPKDFEFEKELMVRLWMAEGFVQLPKDNRRLEEIGDGYFRELTSRSLLQQSIGQTFIMHDLINDLAKFASGEFCFRFEDNWLPKFSKVRHFSFLSQNDFGEVMVINEAMYLRTFLMLGHYAYADPMKKVLDNLFSTQRYLRVISLHGCGIVELPNSIGDLIHLRYLDLSDTIIKCLPKSIGRLCNLQTLLLRGCGDLTVLPKNTWKLNCLRHLDISGTNLRKMPKHIGRLESLQGLEKFIVGKHKGTRITELSELRDLHGSMSILNLQNVSNGVDASKANLKNKKHLEELNLEWSGNNINDDSQSARDVLEKLQPHTNLKYLRIKNYGGTRFPDWIEDKSFTNIRSWWLSHCDSLKSFPVSLFPNLQTLSIDHCRNLESLSVIENGLQDLTSFQSLEIWFCPNMESLAGGGLRAPNLTNIDIKGCEKLKSLPEQMCTLLSSLHSLKMWNLPEIESFPEGGLPHTLSYLYIQNCKKLMGRRREWGLQRLLSLKDLKISGDSEEDALMEHSFPEECLFPASLTSLSIWDRPYMKTLNPNGLRHLNSLQHLNIEYCPKLQCLPDEGLPTSLFRLDIINCPMLKERCQREIGQDWLKIAHIPHIYI